MKKILALTLSAALLFVAGCTSKNDGGSSSPNPSPSDAAKATASSEPTDVPTETASAEKTEAPKIAAGASAGTSQKVESTSDPAATAGTVEGGVLKGKFFTIMMPEGEEVETEQDNSAGDDFPMMMYACVPENDMQLYAVMEMEWAKLVDMVVGMDPEKEMQAEMVSSTIAEMAGESTGVIDVGNMKGFMMDEAAKEKYDMTGKLGGEATVDICVVPSDQVLFLLMYGGNGAAYDQATGQAFFDSFKGADVTTDYMDASVLE